MSLRTIFPILYSEAGMKLKVKIPAGTPVVRAEELPRGYWAQPWRGIKRRELEYLERVGLLLMGAEVGPDLPNFELL